MNHQKKLHIALLMGGPSSEYEVSLATGKIVLRSLDKNKYAITPLIIPKRGQWTIPAKTDIAFVAMHGEFGEDGTIQAILESKGIPYTGSRVLASALAMNKIKSAEIFSFYGLSVPRYIEISKSQNPDISKFLTAIKNHIGFPCVIKPPDRGSSVGISIVKSPSQIKKALKMAFSYSPTVLAQQYIKGDEVTCAVLDEGAGKTPFILPPTQIIPKKSTFFDYKAKYTPGATNEITPPRLPSATVRKIQQTALKAHTILGCSGMSRTDMIVSGKDIFVLETNTIPGMTETSLLPQAAQAAGISFPQLLDKIIQSGLNNK